MEIGKRIREARAKAGLTQEQAAEKLMVSRQSISNWENEKTWPDIVSVVRMSDLYQVSLDFLLKEDKPMSEYMDYLEESTNVVKSKNRLGRLIVLLTGVGIWALSLLVFWFFTAGSDAMGYSLMFLWLLLPITTVVLSAVIGAQNYWGRWKYLAVPVCGILYLLSEYGTYGLSNMIAYGQWIEPEYSMLGVGMIQSILGIFIGSVIRWVREKKKAKEAKEEKKVSKKGKFILVGVAALLLILCYWVIASFNGSLIKRAFVTQKAKDYVSETYPDSSYQVTFAIYDFKFNNYFCIVNDPKSPDASFTVYDTKNGMEDDYDTRVIRKENTISRLSQELDEYFEGWFKENYTHRSSLSYMSAKGEVTEEQRDSLNLNMSLNVREFPLTVTVNVWSETEKDTPTWEELADRLRELEEMTREDFPEDMEFSYSLQAKYIEEDGECKPSDYNSGISVFDVPRAVITGDGLEEYLAQVRAEQEAEEAAIARGEEVK